MAWFTKKAEPKVAGGPDKKSRMEGLWTKCDKCEEILYRQELERNWNVCPLCGFHMAWPARARLQALLDDGIFHELDTELVSEDPLQFSDSKKYRDRLKSTRKNTEENDAFISGQGRINGHPVSLGCFNFEFMGGSMGSVVGEKVTRVFERAFEQRCAAIVFSASGGARMQEGIYSLMQMAKTSAALGRLAQARLPFISVLTHPTMGGVTASFATLGDVILAEPGALIGFAGARVIKDTTKQTLPAGFQTAEFLLKHGLIDQIVSRLELRDRLRDLLLALHVKKKNGAAAAAKI